MILMMFIGASPGSTGGGIKTSTFAVLLLSLKAIFQGKQEIIAYNRTIPTSSVIKAAALLVSALILVILVFLFLVAVENKPYLPLLFETVSAFGTVGLTMGVTPDLTVSGKLLITLLMYLGRIGPLTMGLALARETGKVKIGYPDARIMIG
jgi:trk system potassium uptake protein TrkH